MSFGQIRNVGELELANILMRENVNKLKNVDACLHFSASKCSLAQAGTHYKSNRAEYLFDIRNDNRIQMNALNQIFFKTGQSIQVII